MMKFKQILEKIISSSSKLKQFILSYLGFLFKIYMKIDLFLVEHIFGIRLFLYQLIVL